MARFARFALSLFYFYGLFFLNFEKILKTF